MTRTRKPKQKILKTFKKEGLLAALDFIQSIYLKSIPQNIDFYRDLPSALLDGLLGEVQKDRFLFMGKSKEETLEGLRKAKDSPLSAHVSKTLQHQKQLTRPFPQGNNKPPATLPKSKAAQKRARKKEALREQKFLDKQKREEAQNHYKEKSQIVHESGICPSNPSTWFRTNKRQVTIFCGPTNSGKTYDALDMLKQSSGLYLGPLRLMALEQYDTLKIIGATELLTGEEHLCSRPGVAPLFVSATIESVSFDKYYETVVIDEAQMIFDDDRGWAWTQALMGVSTDHLCVCTAPAALPVLLDMFRQKGESPKVIHKDRMTPLLEIPKISMSSIEAGDALIAFSRKDVLSWKNRLEERGLSVSCIYGDLGPEVRRRQSDQFRKKETDVLVATDAIGMGLNLPIKRVVFTQTDKYDGEKERPLLMSEWQQIAGRAGRRGLYDVGFYTTLKGKLSENTKSFSTYWYRPNVQVIKAASDILKTDKLSDILPMWQKKGNKIRSFKTWTNEVLIAEIDKTNHSLSDKFTYACAPLRDTQTAQFLSWVRAHSASVKNQKEGSLATTVFFPQFQAKPTNVQSELQRLEQQSHLCNLYKWCRRHFPEIYTSDIDQAYADLQNAIFASLAGKLYRMCWASGCQKTLPQDFPHNMCNRCFKEIYYKNDHADYY